MPYGHNWWNLKFETISASSIISICRNIRCGTSISFCDQISDANDNAGWHWTMTGNSWLHRLLGICAKWAKKTQTVYELYEILPYMIVLDAVGGIIRKSRWVQVQVQVQLFFKLTSPYCLLQKIGLLCIQCNILFQQGLHFTYLTRWGVI